MVSDLYIDQAEPADFTLSQAFRQQARATSEMAIRTGRTPCFHFNGSPESGVLAGLNRYADRYNVRPVIDLVPFE